jgi:hypothetical protein
MVQLWTPRPPDEAFADAAFAVQAAGARRASAVETAPAGATFAWLSDLDDVIRRRDVDDETFRILVSRADDGTRVVRAAFVRDGEPVVLEYGPSPAGDPHPLLVATYAAGLDLPEDVREEADEAAARRTATWSLDLLGRMAAGTGALYGTVTVEQPMPTPALLVSGAELSGTPFITRRLMDAVPDLVPALAATLAAKQHRALPGGVLFAGTAPFRTDGAPGVWADHARDAEAARLVGTAVNTFLQQG